MHRAARPERTAPSALPCEWMTPLGGPLLPDVNMIASVSLGVTVSATLSTTARRVLWQAVRRPHLAQGRQCRPFRFEVVEVAVPAELPHGHEKLHGGSA